MRLYTFTGSPSGRKVEAVISHLGLDVQIENVDFLGGELASPEFRSINSNAMVPVLVDGDFRLSESNAILQYLADGAEETTLFPRDRQTRADIARWQFWEVRHFNKAMGTLAFEIVAKSMGGLGSTDDALVMQAQVELQRFALVLEQHLTDRHYLVGDELTIADYSVVAFEAYRERIPFDFSPFPGLTQYLDRVKNTKHWRATAGTNPSSSNKSAQA